MEARKSSYSPSEIENKSFTDEIAGEIIPQYPKHADLAHKCMCVRRRTLVQVEEWL